MIQQENNYGIGFFKDLLFLNKKLINMGKESRPRLLPLGEVLEPPDELVKDLEGAWNGQKMINQNWTFSKFCSNKN